METLGASAPPVRRLPLDDRSMVVLERAVAMLAITAALLVSFAR